MKHLGFTESSLEALSATWTAREICQQPQAWLRTFDAYRESKNRARDFLENVLEKRNLRIILTGAGTSAFIGGCMAPFLTESLQRRVESIPTTDIVSNPRGYLEPGTPTLMVSFARSGNSPESMAAVSVADQILENCYHLVITCNREGGLFRYCGSSPRALALLTPEETNDRSFAMTSSFTSMLLLTGLVFCPDHFERNGLDNMGRIAADFILTQQAPLQTLSQQGYDRVVFLGSGGLGALARESALKLLELTDGEVVALHDSPLGFRHGPKTVINDKTLVFVFISNDPYTRKYDMDLLSELRRDGEAGKVIALSAEDKRLTADDIAVEGASGLPDFMLYFPYIICAQIYAFYRALVLKKKPDNPSATGTVNRVVQGVTIYPVSLNETATEESLADVFGR
ncbi:SIS domain-containing protein [Microbulbifer litoralis]|uniref:SIS domain-containing protein n=1 Tax=Microbulbifer litoralis TaxID=2933965 RepID=UPI002028B54D|nr:SIS domain-containing protein [Microbulbifer sp. GX H0434]